MKKLLLSTFILILFISTNTFAQISIADARAQGAGATVTIKGIITNGGELGAIRYLQDSTGGVAAYSFTMAPNVIRGDEVTMTGVLKDYNGLLELDPVTSYTVLSQGNALPAPVVVTPNQFGETYEALILQINNATFDNPGGTFSGNTNYDITAAGQTGEIRVNTASPLVGQVIPTGTVNILGIMSQYYTTYQLLIRDGNDIIPTASINITSPLMVDNISTSGFDLSWTTDVAGSTEIFYGNTPLLELGHMSVPGDTVDHKIHISGPPAEIFYVRAFSVYNADTAMTTTKVFATVSNSTGEMKVYFNRTVDHSVSLGTNAVQLPNAIDDTVIAYIGRAKYSIDMTIYNFNNQNISNISTALNNAYNSGIEVRVIFDGDANNTGISQLDPGIHALASPVAQVWPSDTGIMHNKFLVFDAGSIDHNDPIVWTGATNFTDGQINTDPNDVIIIQDKSLAMAYTLEFEEMWGSQGLAPDPALSRFGYRKEDNTPHEFIIGGNRVECYFSPSDGVNGKIIETIQGADNNLYVNTMLITRSDIGYAIRDQHNTGVGAQVLVNNQGGCSSTVVGTLESNLGSNFKEYGEAGILHHKLMIVDQASPADDPLVLTGCHNWSSSADERNDENTLIVHNQDIANQYYQEFIKRWGYAVTIGVKENSIVENQFNVYPNPSNGQIWLDFTMKADQEISIEVFDISGRMVYSETQSFIPGDHKFNLCIDHLINGMYIVKLNGEGFNKQKKIIVNSK